MGGKQNSRLASGINQDGRSSAKTILFLFHKQPIKQTNKTKNSIKLTDRQTYTHKCKHVNGVKIALTLPHHLRNTHTHTHTHTHMNTYTHTHMHTHTHFGQTL